MDLTFGRGRRGEDPRTADSLSKARAVRWAVPAFAVGVLILGGVALTADLKKIAAAAGHVGLTGYAVLAAVNFPTVLLAGLAWKIIIGREPGRGYSFAELVKLKMAASSVNALTPGYILGEPVRILLTRRGLGLEAGAASAILDRYLEMIGNLLFMALAAAAGFGTGVLPGRFAAAGFGALAVAAGALAGLGWALMRRLPPSSRVGRFAGAARCLLGRRAAAFDRTRALLGDHLAGRRPALAAAAGIHALKTLWIALFFCIALRLMGFPSPPLTAGLFAAAGPLVALIPIPESVGTEEAAFGALAAALGSPPEAGISLALCHKAVRWLWIALGLWIGASRARRAVIGGPDS